MRKIRISTIGLFICFVFVLFVYASKAVMAQGEDRVLIQVGDTKLKKSTVNEVLNSNLPDGKQVDFDNLPEHMQQSIALQVVSEYVARDLAEEEGFLDRQEIKDALERLKLQFIMQRFYDHKASELVSEEELRKAYDEKYGDPDANVEVRASHILVESEEKAREIMEKLRDGDSFNKLAEDFSNDPGSKAKGGDLGYFTRDVMVKEFADAAFKGEVGDLVGPVETDFGWHVIRIDDRRQGEKPAFEEVKQELRDELVIPKLQEYMGKNIDEADATLYQPDGTAVPIETGNARMQPMEQPE